VTDKKLAEEDNDEEDDNKPQVEEPKKASGFSWFKSKYL
jgi:hypothetical protein